MLNALRAHWPEYFCEALLLGSFMVAACFAAFTFEHPDSPLRKRWRSPLRRRAVIGLLMGLTAVALIYSPLGRRSGAHMNPGTTLTFLVLGTIKPWDACWYILSQFVGGLAGVAAAGAVLGRSLAHPSVCYAATQPGVRGARAAWAAEFAIAFGMMGMVLLSSNHAVTAPYTGVFAGLMVALFITVEAPLSGMSMNPARTLASAIPARAFRGLWVYFTAPPLAMLAAAGVYKALSEPVYCAKLNHGQHHTCIFNCRIGELPHRNPTDPRGIQVGPASASAER